MIDLPIHSETTAPEAARPLLAQSKKRFGTVFNLFGTMAESPALLQGYLTLSDLFTNSTLSPAEQAVVLLTVSRVHECPYCMAAHSTDADMKKVPAEIVEAIREDHAIPAARFESLRRLTEQLVARRGWPDPLVISSFLSAGYTRQQLLEVVLGVGLKTLSNYTNHLADTPLDAAFAHRKWSQPAVSTTRSAAG